MERLADLLDRLPDETLMVLAGPADSDRQVRTLSTIDSLDQLWESQPGALVLVPRYCSELLTGYELDVAVRYAADRGVAGLVLIGCDRVPLTVKALAARAEITLLGSAGTESVVELIRLLDRLLDGGQVAALERAGAALEQLRAHEGLDDHQELLRVARARLGADLRLTWFGSDPGHAEPVTVGGRPSGWVHGSDPSDLAVALVLPSLAAVLGRIYERRILLDEAKGDIVANLIDADASTEDRVAQRARAAGVNVDARHVVACILSEQGSDASSGEGLLARRHRRALAAIAVRELVDLDGARLIVTRVERDLALLWSQAGVGEIDLEPAVTAADSVVGVLRSEYPSIRFFAGVGSVGSGVDGLRSSAIEARAAARSARSQGLSGRALQMDASRLGQVLGEIIASPVSRRAINELLAPLDALPSASRHTSILTLSTYLDLQGSNRKAGARLHLHPNAVSYRINKIVKLLAVDLTEPDARFALQLACRVWLLHQGGGASDSGEETSQAWETS